MTHVSDFSGSTWDANQYLKYAKYRLRPALDLINRINLKNPKRIYDLGCGAGNVTAYLQKKWPAAIITGIDHSKEMIIKARASSNTIDWIQADVATWEADETPDLIFSNSVFHWIDDHPSLFSRLIQYLKTGGCLAVQMPLSWHAMSHELMRQTLHDGGVQGSPLGPESLRMATGKQWVEDPGSYCELLMGHAANIDIWDSTYQHILYGEDPVYNWVKGAGLRPILEGLNVKDLERFITQYKSRLAEAYPQQRDGTTRYPFPRLFIVATV